MTGKDFSLEAGFDYGLNVWANNFTYFAKVMAILAIFWLPTLILGGLPSGDYMQDPQAVEFGSKAIISLAFTAVYSLLMNGVKKIGLKFYDEAEVRIKTLFLSGITYGKLVLLFLLMIVGITLYTALGALFSGAVGAVGGILVSEVVGFVVGGLFGIVILVLGIHLFLRFLLGSYILIDQEEKGVIAALKTSFQLTEGSTVKLFAVFLIWMVISLITGTVPVLLGNNFMYVALSLVSIFVVLPIMYSTYCSIYRQLQPGREKAEDKLDLSEE